MNELGFSARSSVIAAAPPDRVIDRASSRTTPIRV